MDKIIELLEEIYELTLRQEKAVELGAIPRFMRLLNEKQVKLEQIDNIDIEKNINMIYDETYKKRIDELINKINELNDRNVEELKKQKKDIKKEIDKITNGQKIVNQAYMKQENSYGRYFDNKK